MEETYNQARKLCQDLGEGHQVCRESQKTLEQATKLTALAGEHGIVAYTAIGTSLRGWALGELGHRREGIAMIRESLSAHSKFGAEIARLHFRSLLAEALLKDEQIEEGLAILAEVLEMVHRTGGYYYAAELYRLQGELLLKSNVANPQSEAEACFNQAIEIARLQNAKSWELRSTLSLARLWHEQDKQDEARRKLAKIYGWFTEGFDTVDLKEAKALLEDLA